MSNGYPVEYLHNVQWLPVEYLHNVQWQPVEYLHNVQWLPADYLYNVQWLPEHLDNINPRTTGVYMYIDIYIQSKLKAYKDLNVMFGHTFSSVAMKYKCEDIFILLFFFYNT